MSLIYGIIAKHGQDIDQTALDLMAKAHPAYSYDRDLRCARKQVSLGKFLRFNTPESFYSTQPQVKEPNRKIIVFDGRIDNRNELATELSIPFSELGAFPDEEIILKAYEHWGNNCCNKLLGDFVFVIISEQHILIARDHVGARPLFISENDELLAFASNKNALLALPWVNRQENTQWIADTLCLAKVDKSATYYQGISSFLPAHYRTFTIDSYQETDTCRQYWALDLNNTIELNDDEEYIETFRGLLTESVSCRLRSAYPVATELSGGLDSTTVTSVANQLVNARGDHPLIACSHVFPTNMRGKVFPYQDEYEQISSFLDLNNIAIRKFVSSTGRSSIDCLERNVKLHGSPARSDLTLYSEDLFESIKPYGSRVLLSGYGGDQVVSSFAHGFFDEIAKSGQYYKLWKELSSLHDTAHAGYHWVKWLLKSTLPIAEQSIDLYRRKKQPLLFNWQSLLQKLFVTPSFAQEHGFPKRHFRNPPWLVKGGIRERELYLVNRAALCYRLEDSAVGAEFHGVEYRYPLLDKRLLEFCLALPRHQKYRNGVNRRMIRVHGKDSLPSCIQNRNTKIGCGSTIPNANYRRVKDKDHFISALNDMKLTLGQIEHSNWAKLTDYASKLTSQPKRDKSEIPKAFDKSYQVLFTQMSNIGP